MEWRIPRYVKKTKLCLHAGGKKVKKKNFPKLQRHIKADEKEGRGWILKAFFDLFNGPSNSLLLVFGGHFMNLFDLACDVADLRIRCRSGAKFTKGKKTYV